MTSEDEIIGKREPFCRSGNRLIINGIPNRKCVDRMLKVKRDFNICIVCIKDRIKPENKDDAPFSKLRKSVYLQARQFIN